jgi:hypothetical protein
VTYRLDLRRRCNHSLNAIIISIIIIIIIIRIVKVVVLPLWSSGQSSWLQPEVRVRVPELPDFLRSSVSAAGSPQPREYN